MSITDYEWSDKLQIEALKFWFYGISVSLLLGYYQLFVSYFFSNTPQPTPTLNEKSTEEELAKVKEETARTAAVQATRSKILTQLAIDHCDIFLPGSAVGWIPADQAMVGLCQSISSVLAMGSVWEKVGMAE